MCLDEDDVSFSSPAQMTLNGVILQGYRTSSLSLSLWIFGFVWRWWSLGPAATPKNQSSVLATPLKPL